MVSAGSAKGFILLICQFQSLVGSSHGYEVTWFAGSEILKTTSLTPGDVTPDSLVNRTHAVGISTLHKGVSPVILLILYQHVRSFIVVINTDIEIMKLVYHKL